MQEYEINCALARWWRDNPSWHKRLTPKLYSFAGSPRNGWAPSSSSLVYLWRGSTHTLKESMDAGVTAYAADLSLQDAMI